MTIQREILNPFASKKGYYVNKQKEEFKPYHRTEGISPIFTFKNAELTTTKEELFDIHSDKPATQKYGIFTTLRVTNTSTYNIILYPNQDRNRGIFIANNSSVEFNRESLGGGYTSFIIENIGAGTISANELRIECYKEGETINSAVKRANKFIHKASRIMWGY